MEDLSSESKTPSKERQRFVLSLTYEQLCAVRKRLERDVELHGTNRATDDTIARVEELVLVNSEASGADKLTAREVQVAEALSRGISNRDIAKDLSISVKTVDTHRSNVMKKLGLANNSQLTHWAIKWGFTLL